MRDISDQSAPGGDADIFTALPDGDPSGSGSDEADSLHDSPPDNPDDADASALTQDADIGDDAASEEEGAASMPDTYEDFDLPEGWEIDADRSDQFSDWARDQGMTQSQAQAAVDFYVDLVAGDQSAQAHALQEQQLEWTQASRAFGLLKPDALHQARVGLKAVDGDGKIAEALSMFGLDRHPGLISVFRSYGQSISSPGDIPTASSGGAVKKTPGEILYPNHPKE